VRYKPRVSKVNARGVKRKERVDGWVEGKDNTNANARNEKWSISYEKP